jgi:serine/threonine-protein kinase
VVTRSGKTACQIRAEDVGCQVQWSVPTPLQYGAPANGVRVSASGDWEWVTGDMGNQSYTTLAYGTTYRALGWTITPTSDRTTFTYDVTGHGMTVGVQGVKPF